METKYIVLLVLMQNFFRQIAAKTTRVYLSVGEDDITYGEKVCDEKGMRILGAYALRDQDECPFNGWIDWNGKTRESKAYGDIFHSCSSKSRCIFDRNEFDIKELAACNIDVQYECNSDRNKEPDSIISPTTRSPTVKTTQRPTPTTSSPRPSPTTQSPNRNRGQVSTTDHRGVQTLTTDTPPSTSYGEKGRAMEERWSLFMIILITIGCVAVVAVVVVVLLCGLFFCGWSPRFNRWVSIRRRRRQQPQQQQQQTTDPQADEYAYIDERELLSNSKTDSTAISPVTSNGPPSSKFSNLNPVPRFVSGPGLTSPGDYVDVPDPKACPVAEYSNINPDVKTPQPIPETSMRQSGTSISVIHVNPSSPVPTPNKTEELHTINIPHQQHQAEGTKAKEDSLRQPSSSLIRVTAPGSQPPAQYTLPSLKVQHQSPTQSSGTMSPREAGPPARPAPQSPTQSSGTMSPREAGPPARPAPLLPRQSSRRRASLPRQSKLMENIPEDGNLRSADVSGVSRNSQPSLALHSCTLQGPTNDSKLVLDLGLYAHLGQSTKSLDPTNVYDG